MSKDWYRIGENPWLVALRAAVPVWVIGWIVPVSIISLFELVFTDSALTLGRIVGQFALYLLPFAVIYAVSLISNQSVQIQLSRGLIRTGVTDPIFRGLDRDELLRAELVPSLLRRRVLLLKSANRRFRIVLNSLYGRRLNHEELLSLKLFLAESGIQADPYLRPLVLGAPASGEHAAKRQRSVLRAFMTLEHLTLDRENVLALLQEEIDDLRTLPGTPPKPTLLSFIRGIKRANSRSKEELVEGDVPPLDPRTAPARLTPGEQKRTSARAALHLSRTRVKEWLELFSITPVSTQWILQRWFFWLLFVFCLIGPIGIPLFLLFNYWYADAGTLAALILLSILACLVLIYPAYVLARRGAARSHWVRYSAFFADVHHLLADTGAIDPVLVDPEAANTKGSKGSTGQNAIPATAEDVKGSEASARQQSAADSAGSAGSLSYFLSAKPGEGHAISETAARGQVKPKSEPAQPKPDPKEFRRQQRYQKLADDFARDVRIPGTLVISNRRLVVVGIILIVLISLALLVLSVMLMTADSIAGFNPALTWSIVVGLVINLLIPLNWFLSVRRRFNVDSERVYRYELSMLRTLSGVAQQYLAETESARSSPRQASGSVPAPKSR